jgi:hypothetical protein
MLSVPALGAPLRVKNGHAVQLRLGAGRERGVALRPMGRSWRLELGRSDAERAELVDVTVGAPASRWTVAVVGDALTLDPARFVADHAYRVQLRRGVEDVGSALIYLYPPRTSAKQTLEFSDDEAPGDDEIAVTPKPSL